MTAPQTVVTDAAHENTDAAHENERDETELAETHPTALSIVDGQGPPLSLTALHAALTKAGVDIPYSTLSQFVSLGDIAEQLGVGGKGNRREFPQWTADFLAEFLPWYQASKINKELAPDAMRHNLSKFWGSRNSKTGAGNADMTFIAATEKTQPGNSAEMGFATRLLSGVLTPLTAVLGDLAGAIHGLRSERPSLPPAPAPVEDRLLTAEQAAEMLACHPRSVSRYVTPVRPRTWRYSDCQRYIERLGEALEDAQREAAK